LLDWLVYGLVGALTLGVPLAYYTRMRRLRQRAFEAQQAVEAAGLKEPSSLHPVIDPVKCIGCATCVDACPEGEILGLINGKAELIEPTRCIGHGACQSACPMGAIDLVFGTATRGVDIPHVKPNFETNQEGLYIAGELGGMGLIRNAVNQGRQAMEQIALSLKKSTGQDLDVLVVGAGPAGLSATLQAVKSGLKYVTIDQAPDLGGTVLHFPRQKLVMTQPMEIPLYGQYKQREVSKEDLLKLFQSLVRDSQLTIQFGEKVESVARQESGFEVRTNRGTYHPARVLLAIGRRGTPRKLDVPGEELPKVAYSLLEPGAYAYKKVLVVGGGDSAVEAALALGDAPGCTVTLSYRKTVFSRLKDKNRTRLAEAERLGRVKTSLPSDVVKIEPTQVQLSQNGRAVVLPNDYVFVFAGGEPPTAFLTQAGVQVETKFGTR
jgi:thioredoxin reductase/ferredoxin